MLVIFGITNILSDLFDCALANGLPLSKIVVHHPECVGERDVALAERIAALGRVGESPRVQTLADFRPAAGECYMLGPTTPTRAALAEELHARFGLRFHTMIHPRAYVSPLARLGQGVFVGANTTIGPGVVLGKHVFVNRGATIGHDTRVGDFSRVQPGCNLGGLSHIGERVSICIGATVIERIRIGDDAVIGAGAVVTSDIPAGVLAAGVPAVIKKKLNQAADASAAQTG